MPRYSVDVWYREENYLNDNPSDRVEIFSSASKETAAVAVLEYLKSIGKSADVIHVREGL